MAVLVEVKALVFPSTENIKGGTAGVPKGLLAAVVSACGVSVRWDKAPEGLEPTGTD